MQRHAASQLLADLGISRREYDPVLDSRVYVKLGLATESDSVDKIEIDDTPETQDIEAYHQAMLDLQKAMSEPVSYSFDDSVLQEIGVPEEIIASRPSRRDILKFIEETNEELDVQSSVAEEGKLALSVDQYNKMAKLDAVRNKLMEFTNTFFLAESKLHGANSDTGYFITPQMLALSIWSESSLSSAAQVEREASKDARGGWNPIFQDNGLDVFVTADNPSVQVKTLAGWISKEMDFAYARIGPQIDKFDENVVTLFDTVSEGSPVTAPELSKVLNAYYGFNLSEPLAESGKDLLNKFEKTGMNLSPYLNKILYREFLEKAKSENKLKKTRLSSYAGNGVFMNDGGIVKRGRLNLIPGETYVKFINLLINGAKNIKAEHVLEKITGFKTNILRITQDGRVIQEIQYSNSKAMVEAYKSINQLTSAGDGFKSQLFALSGLDSVKKASQALDFKKVGALVIYKGDIHKIEEVDGKKKLVKADPDEVYRNKNGEYNYAILQTAFMMAFSKADPAAFYTKGAVNTVSGQPLDRAGISAVARDTQSLNALNPDLVDAFSTDAGQGIVANINEDLNDFEHQQDQATDYDQDAPEVDNRKSNLQRLLSWIFGKQTLVDAFSRAGVRRKFRLNESMRRNLVSQGKHFLHSGFVNSYYELEEMNELMIEDLVKKGVVDPKNQAEMDSIRLNQKIRLYMGKTGVEIDEAKARYETPFMEKLGDLKMDDPLHFFGNYVYARFAKVRNKYVREKYKKSPMAKGVDDEGNVLGSGMKDEEADRIMEATRNHPEFKKLNNIVKAFDRMNENTLEILVKGEVLSMDQYKRLKKAATNENGEFVWAPLRGFEKEMIEDYPTGLDMIQELIHRDEVSGAQGTGSGFSQTGGRLALTAALGRTTKANAHEIWGNAFRGNLEAILRANKNKETSQALLELLKKVNSDKKLKEEWGGIFQIVRPADLGVETKKKLKLTYDPDLGEDRSYIQEIEVNALELEDNVFTVRVRGEPVYIMFKGETGRRISDALKNKNNFQMGPFLRGLGTASGFFSSLYTVWNLDFILTNFFRDFVSGILNLKSDQETRDIANQIVNPRSMHDNFKGMYAVAKARRQGKTMDSVLSDSDRVFVNEILQKERSDVTEEDLTRLFSSPEMTAIAMQKAGGKVEFFGLIDAEKKTSDIIRKLKNFNKSGKPFNQRNAGAKFFDWVNDINTGVENATRMQAFKVMVMNGATFQNAAYKGGREGTVDFNRKGNYTNVMNALFPFFGAGVAGNSRLVRALMSPDMGGSKEFKQRLALKIIMGGFTYSLLMRAFAGEDEETEEQHWDRLSSWEKKHGLNVFLKPNGDGGRVVIPLPYGWNLLYGIGATMADFAVDSAGFSDRKYGAFEAASEVMTSAMDTFHPMSGGTGLGRVVPHAFRPAVYEIPFNKNFMGNPIRPEPNKFEVGETPDSQLYFSSVNPISRDITNFINTATGGNEQQAGLIDVSPSSIDHILGYFFGTMGRQIMTISGFAYDTAKGKTPDIGSTRAIPVISRLYKDETKDYQMQTRFFDLRKHTGGYFKRHKYLLDQGDTQGAREFFNKNRNALKVYSLVDAHTKRIGKFKRDINKRKKSGILGSKIQPLEDRMQSERIRGMSSILKQARQLGIYL
jgi:hypothetical protein